MIKCHHCEKIILKGQNLEDIYGEPFTLIEHCQQPGSRNTQYYFHTRCFLSIAGEEYSPKHTPMTPEDQYDHDDAIRRILKVVKF